MKAKIYNTSAKETGSVELSEKLFGLPMNGDLLKQVVVSMQSNARAPFAHAKDRSEVSGGGKKPWKQKGTGRARHGSTRSPIWVGGGVTHGPSNERNFDKKINKKMKDKAFRTALSAKLADNEVLFVDDLGITDPKTQIAQKMIDAFTGIPGFEKMNYKRGNRALVVVPKTSQSASKSFSNIKSAKVVTAQDLSLLDLVNYRYVVIATPEESLAVFENRVR